MTPQPGPGVLQPEQLARHIVFDSLEPTPAVAHWVERIWSVTWDLPAGTHYVSSLVANPSISLTVERGDGQRAGRSGDGVWLTGVMTQRFDVRTHGCGGAVGVKFHPGGFTALTGLSARPLTDTVAPAATYLPTADQLADLALNATSARAALCAYVLSLATERSPTVQDDSPDPAEEEGEHVRSLVTERSRTVDGYRQPANEEREHAHRPPTHPRVKQAPPARQPAPTRHPAPVTHVVPTAARPAPDADGPPARATAGPPAGPTARPLARPTAGPPARPTAGLPARPAARPPARPTAGQAQPTEQPQPAEPAPPTGPSSAHPRSSIHLDKRYDQVRHAMAQLADDRITRVDALADACGLSERTLQRLLRQYVGVGPKWLLMRHRLQDAVTRIDAGFDGTLADLAAQVGWYDQNHFIRDFTAIVGVTPAAYRDRPRP